MSTHAEIDFASDGSARCLYHEAVDLGQLGKLTVTRASTVEFNAASQKWEVIPRGATQKVFSSPSRATCLDWERQHLRP